MFQKEYHLFSSRRASHPGGMLDTCTYRRDEKPLYFRQNKQSSKPSEWPKRDCPVSVWTCCRLPMMKGSALSVSPRPCCDSWPLVTQRAPGRCSGRSPDPRPTEKKEPLVAVNSYKTQHGDRTLRWGADGEPDTLRGASSVYFAPSLSVPVCWWSSVLERSTRCRCGIWIFNILKRSGANAVREFLLL